MTHIFQVNQGVLYQTVADEAVLLNINDNHYYGLDDIAARIWTLLMECGEVDAVVARMLQEYAVDEATLRTDISALLVELEKRGLIARVAQ